MATLERRAVEALLADLRESQAVEDRVFEDRGFTIDATDLPALDVQVVDDEPDVRDLFDQQLAHRLRVEVAVMVREANGVPPAKIADPIAAVTHRAVMRSTRLPAVVQAVTPGPTRIARQTSGDGVVMRRAMTYTFEFSTAVDDLEAVPA